MRYFWVPSLYWREFLLPYVFPSLPYSCIVYSQSRVSPFVCLAAGYTCYRDSANNPQCSLDSTNTLTRTSTFRIPTSTPTSTSDNSDENSDDDSSTSTPTVPKLTSTSSRSTSTSTTPRSTPTSTTPNPSPSGVISSSANGAVGWEGSSGYFGLAPFLVLIGTCLW